MRYRTLTALLPLIAVGAILLGGCATVHPNYDVVLSAVERPAEAEQRWGPQVLSTVTEEGIQRYVFEDEMIKVLWIVSSSTLNFVLENKTDHSLKIIWDETAYVGVDSVSGRVMHSGVKYTDRNNSQPPSVIVRKGKISDMVVPVDNVYYASGWHTLPLFPTAATTKVEAEEKAQIYVGKNVQVLLPIEIEGVTNEYVFVFEVRGFEVP